MSSYAIGELVECRTATGEWVERRAMSDVEPGYDFAVVWVCRTDGRGDTVPWPADAVRSALSSIPTGEDK